MVVDDPAEMISCLPVLSTTSQPLLQNADRICFTSAAFLLSISFASAQSPVRLNFYTDQACVDPSTENPVASITLQECLFTTGFGPLSIPSVPCTSGDVQLLAFADTACGTQLDVMDWYKVSNTCAAGFRGDIAAILLICNQETDAGTVSVGDVTVTSTILVGSVANSAATVTPSAGSASAAVPTPTSSIAPSASIDAPSRSGSASDSSIISGLSLSDKIALGVGLGVGIPQSLYACISYYGESDRYIVACTCRCRKEGHI